MKKESYKLPIETNMYDMSFCCADCKTECARRKACGGICTVSDFSSVCSDYKKKDK